MERLLGEYAGRLPPRNRIRRSPSGRTTHHRSDDGQDPIQKLRRRGSRCRRRAGFSRQERCLRRDGDQTKKAIQSAKPPASHVHLNPRRVS